MRTGSWVGQTLVSLAVALGLVLPASAAPPRSIADITAVLDQFKPDAAKLAAARTRADAAPPAGLPTQRLAEFLFERAQAAADIGRRDQMLADAREAVTVARRGNHPALSRFVQYLASAEEEVGNLRAALSLNRERLQTARTPPQQLTAYTAIASVQLRMGAFADAERSLQSAESFIGRVQSGGAGDGHIMGPVFQLQVDGIRNGIAIQSGRTAGAEPTARRVLARSDEIRKDANIARIRDAAQVQADVYQRQYLNAAMRLTRLLFKEGRLADAETEARRGLNEALGFYGRYSPMGAALVLVLAQVVYEQGRYADAATLAGIAIDTFRQLGAGEGSFQLAEALMVRGRVLHNTGDTILALAAFEEARALFPRDEALRRRYVEDDLTYVAALLASGQAATALPNLERMAADRLRQFGEKNLLTVEARAWRGAALARLGRRGQALEDLRTSLPTLTQASRQIEDETSGADRDRRLRFLVESFMEQLLTPLSGPGTGPGPGAGRPPGAGPGANRPPAPPVNRDMQLAAVFRLSDTARSRGVLRALNASALRASVGSPEQADLVRREQDAQKQISAQLAVLTSLLAGPPEDQDAETVQGLRVAIDRLRDERAALRQEIERRFPNYANLIDPRPADPEDVQKALRPNEALLSIYVGAEKTFVAALRATGPVDIAMVDLGEKAIAARVAHLRKALDPSAETLGDVPPFDVVAAHELYAQLIAPVAATLAGADSLIVVPDKALGQLPFGLLVSEPASAPDAAEAVPFAGYRGVPFLIRRFAVSQLPSTTALLTLRGLPAAAAARRAFAGFGDPWFNADHARTGAVQVFDSVTAGLQTRGRPLKRRSAPATERLDEAGIGVLPRLPETADEVRAIAAALRADPATDVFLGRAASEASVKAADLVNRRVVMFATHGLIPGDIDGLDQPALALTAPSVVPGGEDGLLTMEEILALRLDADWVVLSACNTGAADGAGAEAASGLGRAFFYAGTRAVLLTNWPVETNSARDLTTDLFRRQADDPNLSRAKAMQQAMLGLIDGQGYVEGGRSVFSYAHPIFWAPFSVIGDGGV